MEIKLLGPPTAEKGGIVEIEAKVFNEQPRKFGAAELVLRYDRDKIIPEMDYDPVSEQCTHVVDTGPYDWYHSGFIPDFCKFWYCHGWNLTPFDGNFWLRLMGQKSASDWPVMTSVGLSLAKFRFKVLVDTGKVNVGFAFTDPAKVIGQPGVFGTAIYNDQTMRAQNVLRPGELTGWEIDLDPQVPEEFLIGSQSGEGRT